MTWLSDVSGRVSLFIVGNDQSSVLTTPWTGTVIYDPEGMSLRVY